MAYKRYQPDYRCPFCDMIMPNKEIDRKTHACNWHDIERKKILDNLGLKTWRDK